MKIHLQSDMHIEGGTWQLPAVSSHVAVCAGDIGLVKDLPKLKKYFDGVKETTDNVIWVLGNHEFYHHDYQRTIDDAAEFSLKEGIHLLDESIGTDNLVIDGVTFWGSTLWTDSNKSDWFVLNTLGNGMNDFHVITDKKKGLGKRFTVHDSIDINTRTREKINWDADVIVTHHHPLLREHSRFKMSNVTYGFCNTGLEQQIIDSDVKLWLFGHTHDSTYEELNGTRVVSNQQGYARDDYHTGRTSYENTNFDPSLILEV